MNGLTKDKLITVAAYAFVAAVIVGLLAAGTALGNTQTISATASPAKHPKKAVTPASIAVHTTTGPDAPGAQIFPATRAQIYFDNDFVFNATGLPVCRANIDSLNAQMAKEACYSSIVGSGTGKVALAGYTDTVLDAVITAFNGPPRNGHPMLLLHSWTEAVGLGTTLTGELKPYGKGGYGKVLDVTIPALPLGSAIIDFYTEVGRNFTYKGKKQSYIKARCATKRWAYKGVFTYTGAATKTATASQGCRN